MIKVSVTYPSAEGTTFDRLQLEDYLGHLRAHESDVRTRPHPYEMSLYFDV